MTSFPEGSAVVYCEGAFGTPNGKTAHGLVRRTRRYRILSVIDSTHAGKDTGLILDGQPNGILIYPDLETAMSKLHLPPSHFIMGLAPDGGRLSPKNKSHVIEAIQRGLHVDSGLHDFLSEDPDVAALASKHRVRIRDIRKPPDRKDLHFFSGKIEQVDSLKIALLGTDSAVGKRTTAWILTEALNKAGYKSEMIGTGQTAWMQGVRFGIILDSLVNDFVSGEIEHAVWSAWNESHPDIIIIEGQGSLMNPAYPGGFEILAAGRPDAVVLQHAPARKEYDGFPGYPIHPIDIQIQAIELLSEKSVIAVTINHESLSPEQVRLECQKLSDLTELPAVDILWDDPQPVIETLIKHMKMSLDRKRHGTKNSE